jgi:hypothetical protein
MRRTEGEAFRIVSDARQSARSNAPTSRNCSPWPSSSRASITRDRPAGCLIPHAAPQPGVRRSRAAHWSAPLAVPQVADRREHDADGDDGSPDTERDQPMLELGNPGFELGFEEL